MNPSAKYEFVSWDDDIPNIWENNPNVPNHQPVMSLDSLDEGFVYIRLDVLGYIYIYMGVDQNIVAGVLLEMTLRPPLRFLALFKVFIVFHYRD